MDAFVVELAFSYTFKLCVIMQGKHQRLWIFMLRTLRRLHKIIIRLSAKKCDSYKKMHFVVSRFVVFVEITYNKNVQIM